MSVDKGIKKKMWVMDISIEEEDSMKKMNKMNVRFI